MGPVFGCLFVLYGMVIWIVCVAFVWGPMLLVGGKAGRKPAVGVMQMPMNGFWRSGNRFGCWLGDRISYLHRQAVLRWGWQRVWGAYGIAALLYLLYCLVRFFISRA